MGRYIHETGLTGNVYDDWGLWCSQLVSSIVWLLGEVTMQEQAGCAKCVCFCDGLGSSPILVLEKNEGLNILHGVTVLSESSLLEPRCASSLG